MVSNNNLQHSSAGLLFSCVDHKNLPSYRAKAKVLSPHALQLFKIEKILMNQFANHDALHLKELSFGSHIPFNKQFQASLNLDTCSQDARVLSGILDTLETLSKDSSLASSDQEHLVMILDALVQNRIRTISDIVDTLGRVILNSDYSPLVQTLAIEALHNGVLSNQPGLEQSQTEEWFAQSLHLSPGYGFCRISWLNFQLSDIELDQFLNPFELNSSLIANISQAFDLHLLVNMSDALQAFEKQKFNILTDQFDKYPKQNSINEVNAPQLFSLINSMPSLPKEADYKTGAVINELMEHTNLIIDRIYSKQRDFEVLNQLKAPPDPKSPSFNHVTRKIGKALAHLMHTSKTLQSLGSTKLALKRLIQMRKQVASQALELLIQIFIRDLGKERITIPESLIYQIKHLILPANFPKIPDIKSKTMKNHIDFLKSCAKAKANSFFWAVLLLEDIALDPFQKQMLRCQAIKKLAELMTEAAQLTIRLRATKTIELILADSRLPSACKAAAIAELAEPLFYCKTRPLENLSQKFFDGLISTISHAETKNRIKNQALSVLEQIIEGKRDGLTPAMQALERAILLPDLEPCIHIEAIRIYKQAPIIDPPTAVFEKIEQAVHNTHLSLNECLIAAETLASKVSPNRACSSTTIRLLETIVNSAHGKGCRAWAFTLLTDFTNDKKETLHSCTHSIAYLLESSFICESFPIESHNFVDAHWDFDIDPLILSIVKYIEARIQIPDLVIQKLYSVKAIVCRSTLAMSLAIISNAGYPIPPEMMEILCKQALKSVNKTYCTEPNIYISSLGEFAYSNDPSIAQAAIKTLIQIVKDGAHTPSSKAARELLMILPPPIIGV